MTDKNVKRDNKGSDIPTANDPANDSRVLSQATSPDTLISPANIATVVQELWASVSPDLNHIRGSLDDVSSLSKLDGILRTGLERYAIGRRRGDVCVSVKVYNGTVSSEPSSSVGETGRQGTLELTIQVEDDSSELHQAVQALESRGWDPRVSMVCPTLSKLSVDPKAIGRPCTCGLAFGVTGTSLSGDYGAYRVRPEELGPCLDDEGRSGAYIVDKDGLSVGTGKE